MSSLLGINDSNPYPFCNSLPPPSHRRCVIPAPKMSALSLQPPWNLPTCLPRIGWSNQSGENQRAGHDQSGRFTIIIYIMLMYASETSYQVSIFERYSYMTRSIQSGIHHLFSLFNTLAVIWNIYTALLRFQTPTS